MPHSEVPKIQLSDDGSKVSLTVRVVGFDDGTSVEVSGYATQENGAIATFYKVAEISVNNDGSADIQVPDVDVIPAAQKGNGFVAENPIMAVARAAEVWITKLVKDNTVPVGAAPAWNSDEQTFHSAWKSGPPGGWSPAG
jgi:hypothetical protein